MKSVRDEDTKEFYNSGTSNLSDDLRKMTVFFSIKVLISTLWIISPYKSKQDAYVREQSRICGIRNAFTSLL